MRIETLKTSKRKYFWCALIVGVVLLIILVLTTSMAKYQITESIKIAEGTINYKVPDLNLVAMYIENESGEYVETSSVPTSGYTLNGVSYCGQSDGNGNIIKDASITIEYSNGLVNFWGLSKKGTKCYLYFDIKPTTSIILARLNKLGERSSFSNALTTDPKGVYSAEDDDGTSYYFAGTPTDNYVYFAGFYWRIIRFNGDESIRLIYDGTSAIANGTPSISEIGTSSFNYSSDNNRYVGFMYTNGAVHGLSSSSTIKGTLETWYSDNLASYESYIDTNAGFCGDRTSTTTTGGEPNDTGGTGTSSTYYGTAYRLITNKTPSLKCTYSTDLYTVSSSSKGNKALTNPIGLITADEVAYAGAVSGTSNKNYYLYRATTYWTMSPLRFSNPYAVVFQVSNDGSLSSAAVETNAAVRPVINLKADTTFSSGDGTVENPYVVE